MPELTATHRRLVDAWLGPWEIVADHSWPLQDTAVLHVRAGAGEFIVKASETSHHPAREIAAHRDGYATGWMVAGDEEHRILVLEYVPGVLVEGTPAEWDSAVYEQAGRILDRLQVPGDVDDAYVPRLVERARRALERSPECFPDGLLEAAHRRLDAVRPFPVPLVFTHGDYQPRNWLVDDGELRIIDYGRALFRSAESDLVRLRHQQFVGHPELQAAFERGYGREPGPVLELDELEQATTTVSWAHSIGDPEFEEHGRRMLRRVLAQPPA